MGYGGDDMPPASNRRLIPQPQPQPKPEPVPVEATGTADINKAIEDLTNAVLTGQISGKYEIRKQEIILRQQFDIERERLRALKLHLKRNKLMKISQGIKQIHSRS